MKMNETIFQQLQRHDLRITTIRKALIGHFAAASRPLSYNDLKDSLSMDKATFYRNMDRFEAAGIVRRIESDGRQWHFELANVPHPHFVCERCHRIECLQELPFSAPAGYRIASVVYKGTCRTCCA